MREGGGNGSSIYEDTAEVSKWMLSLGVTAVGVDTGPRPTGPIHQASAGRGKMFARWALFFSRDIYSMFKAVSFSIF